MFWLLPAFLALAQSPSPALFQQYQTDYLYQRDQYTQDYKVYLEKTDIDKQYHSISTQKDKNDAAQKAIASRNLMLKTYLMALRVKLEDYKSANPDATSAIQSNLSSYESWLETNQDLNTRYVAIQQSIYSALVQHQINRQQSGLNLLQNLAGQITNPLLDSLPGKYPQITSHFQQALQLTQKPQYTTFSNFYPEVKTELTKSQNLLIDISTTLKYALSH